MEGCGFVYKLRTIGMEYCGFVYKLRTLGEERCEFAYQVFGIIVKFLLLLRVLQLLPLVGSFVLERGTNIHEI